MALNINSQIAAAKRRLQANAQLSGLDSREERERAKLPAEQRRRDRAHLDVLVLELSQFAATVPAEIDRLAATCVKVIALDEEAFALARALGVRVARRRMRQYVKILLHYRIDGPILLKSPVKAPRMVGIFKAAQEAFCRPWVVEE